jgi:hypothetical protein
LRYRIFRQEKRSFFFWRKRSKKTCDHLNVPTRAGGVARGSGTLSDAAMPGLG